MPRVDNAVILAAGFSSRFVPICFDKPKALLPVCGETLIERQIRQLHDVGVHDIIVITGAYRHQFDFLQTKHHVTLIHNPDYAVKNNFASLYAARSVLKNTIISSSDLFFPDNIFVNQSDYAYYASVFVNGPTTQRCLTLNERDEIIATSYSGRDTWITFGGHAFLTEDISQKLIDLIHPVYHDPLYANKYWVDFQDEHLSDMPMRIKKLPSNAIVEFNTLEALRSFDTNFNARSFSAAMDIICRRLDCPDDKMIHSFEPIKSNNEAAGCFFVYRGKKYQYLHSTQQVELCI